MNKCALTVGQKGTRKNHIRSNFFGKFAAALLFIFVCNYAYSSARLQNISHRKTVRFTAHASQMAVDTDSGQHRKHRLIAALLAFPLTGGILGLHRVYLGTSPLIPLAYIASYGGIAGVLPFVDFMLIVVCKDVNVYAHNNSLFMWSRKRK